MDDLVILNNLFIRQNDRIHFELLKESNIVKISSDNKDNFNKEMHLNTQSLASQIINYKDAYTLVEIQVDVSL